LLATQQLDALVSALLARPRRGRSSWDEKADSLCQTIWGQQDKLGDLTREDDPIAWRAVSLLNIRAAAALPPIVRQLAPDLPQPLAQHILLQVCQRLELPPPDGRRELLDLVEIASRVHNEGVTAHAAAGEVANKIARRPQQRRNERTQLYDHYRERKHAEAYLQIALAPNVETGIDQIIAELERRSIEATDFHAVSRDFSASQMSD